VGQRETNRENKREAIINAGLDHVLTASIDILRSELNASSLSADIGMPKDTAYRLFNDGDSRSSDSVIREVAAAATRPEWSGFSESADEIASTFFDRIQRELPFDQALIEALAANVEAQFRSLGGPVGWLFHSAAITASPAWQGDKGLSEETMELGQELLAIRAEFYQRMTEDLLQIMVAAMSMINRRPRPGMDPRQLLALMHSMIDGAVLRRYIEPDIFDNRIIGEAAYAVAMAFSEDGTLSDPRRPNPPADSNAFDRIVAAASCSWLRQSDRSVESTSREAEVAPEVAHIMFPSLADLADSVVWTRVLGGGSLVDRGEADRTPGSEPGTEMAMTFGLLRRLRDIVESLPGAVELVRERPAVVGVGVLTQLEREVAEVLRCHCPAVDPHVTAAELVRSALAGQDGWMAVTALMRVLDPNST
jgi:hypothetical protein